MLCAYPKGSITNKQKRAHNKIHHRAAGVRVPGFMHSSLLLNATLPIAVVNRQYSSLTRLLSVEKAARNRRIRINPAVAQERPVAADVFEGLQVNISDKNFFAVVRCLGDDAAEGIAKKRAAPELEPMTRSRLAAHVASFKA